MNQITLHGPRDARIDPVNRGWSELGPREIEVQTVATAVSNGTELAAYTARYGTAFYGYPFDYPCSMGYQNIGRVIAVGDEVTNLFCGDHVYSLKPHCSHYRLSLDEMFWQLPKRGPIEDFAFTYLIALGLQALRRGIFTIGERVAVVGLGPIGLATIMLARSFGAMVVGVDLVSERRLLGEKMGAEMTANPAASNFSDIAAEFGVDTGIDLVVETAGTWTALDASAELVRREGRVVVVGLHPDEPKFNVLGKTFFQKQYSIISSSYPPPADFPPDRTRFTLRRTCYDVMSYIATRRISFEAAVTHRIHYSELPTIYERLANGDHSIGAIVILWD